MNKSLDTDPGLTVVGQVFLDSTVADNVSLAFVTPVSADFARYDISAPEAGGANASGRYVLLVPTWLPQNIYSVRFINSADRSVLGSVIADTTTPATTPVATSGNTTAYYTSKLAAIDAAIDKILANPRPNYQVGQTRMDMGSLLETLERTRDRCLYLLNSIQPESFETLNTDVNEFGQDISDYINENPT